MLQILVALAIVAVGLSAGWFECVRNGRITKLGVVIGITLVSLTAVSALNSQMDAARSSEKDSKNADQISRLLNKLDEAESLILSLTNRMDQNASTASELLNFAQSNVTLNTDENVLRANGELAIWQELVDNRKAHLYDTLRNYVDLANCPQSNFVLVDTQKSLALQYRLLQTILYEKPLVELSDYPQSFISLIHIFIDPSGRLDKSIVYDGLKIHSGECYGSQIRVEQTLQASERMIEDEISRSRISKIISLFELDRVR
ncbi:MAG: hypothetical protein AAGJ84_10165 [Pseudomonadota bacterium]